MSNFASLCILSYERPALLTKSLESLVENTTEPYELIIHDDGSGINDFDGSMEMVLRDLQDDYGATVIRNKTGWNQGQGVALNRMFEMSRGNPVIKLDADLEYTPGWLGKTTDLLEKHGNIGLLGLLHYEHDPVDMRKTMTVNHEDYEEHTHILGSAFAMRRNCYTTLAPFPEHSEAFAEDWVMQKRVTESLNWCCALPKEPLVHGEQNMGLGKSVVVNPDGSVHKIHKEPYIINAK